ncbi:hypothetical protein ACSBL2_09250 [Pedobacter sp. AW31-3R]|uniref:hypothetical protein n=1 Tax=Pedobacter sp. AW31-3R TaxID=3445781 RepID=UPI003F9F133D
MTLQHCISPYNFKVFVNEFLEKKPFVINRNQKNYFGPIVRLEDIEDILNSPHLLNTLNISIINAAGEIPDNVYMSFSSIYNLDIKTAVHAATMLEFFHHGKSIVRFNGYLPDSVEAKALQNSVKSELCCNIGLATTVFPYGSKYEKTCVETEDLLLLAFYGNCKIKIWRNDELDCSVPLEFTLNDGDTAFVPKGFTYELFMHDSIFASIHITLMMTTWLKVLTDLIIKLANDDVAFRKAFYPLDRKYSIEEKAEELAMLKDKIISKLSPEMVDKLYKKEHFPLQNSTINEEKKRFSFQKKY